MSGDRPGPSRSDAPWDISFLRVGALATAAAAAVAVPVAALLGGRAAIWGVVVGGALVTAFFCVSGVVIAWAGRIDDALTLPAALGTFLVKVLVLAVVMGKVPPDGWLDRVALAWTVIGAALLWGAVQMRWVWTRQLYYVTPPSGPGRLDDPEKPVSRG